MCFGHAMNRDEYACEKRRKPALTADYLQQTHEKGKGKENNITEKLTPNITTMWITPDKRDVMNTTVETRRYTWVENTKTR